MAEYIGNKKFADMKAKDRRYINGNAEEISSLAEKLTSENIEFSGRITEGRCAITIDNEEAYRKALEYIYEIRTQKTQNSIIGNTSFKFFSRNNRYIANEKSEIMNSVRQILDANKIKYSGVVLGDTTKITVYGENKDYLNSLIEEAKNPEVLKQIEKMNFSVEKKTDGTYLIKNDILNTEKEFISLSEIKSDFDNKDAFLFPTAYRIEMLSDAYDDIYGIYAYNPNTLDQYNIINDDDGWVLTFDTVDNALDYAGSHNIILDNSFKQLKEWRRNDEEAIREENIRKSKEFIDNIDADEDHFVFEEDKIRFTYYNPEGNNEQGQFVEILIFKEDIEEAFRYSFANKNDGFFDYLFTNCNTHLIDAGTEAFIDYAKDFIDKSMSDEPNIYVGNIVDNIDEATNRLLEFIDADEIRKEMNDTAEKMELSYELSVFDKIQFEYNQFLEEVKTYDIDKVISMSGEVSSKKEIYEYLQSNTDFFAEEQYDALVNAENTLDEIYNIRIRERCDVRTAIETSANNILDKNDKDIDKSNNEATFEIYQIYEGEKYRDIRFASYDMLESMNETFDRNNYQKVYTGKLSDIHYDNKLEGIYLEFNANRPEDYEGRSVSVSDVVVIKDENGEKAYYVDSFGFKETPDFFIEKEAEVSPLGTETQNDENLVTEKEVKIHNYSDRDNISFFDYAYQKTLDKTTNQSPVGTKTPNNTKEEKRDFVITDENLGAGGAKTKFKANVEAIKLLNKIENENRLATPEEQEILSKYVGWGGLAQAFDENNDKWENEFKELKELLSPEEYSDAKASTINAFYTSPTVINAIYEGLEKIGFKGGKILEPAMGVGNFFGSMPKEIRENSSLSGVELDSISGRIAKQLYQNADITISGYEKTNFADNSFDVVVGNVPFGDYKVYDKEYNKYNFNIHDYFFAKSLDKVHPGGVVAFVTSQGTMDKKSSEIRQYIAERSELLGAIRLPNDAFKSNAGTEVTSDILFLKKRERPIAVDEHSEEWLGRTFIADNIPVNNYFAKNPDMILGTMVQGNKMYGGEKSNSTMCIPKENSDLKEELKKAITNLQGEYVANTKSYEEKSSSDEVVYATPDIKRYSYAIINDELYYRADGNTMKKVEMPKKNEEICKSMIELRKIATELLDLQVHNINYSFEDEITTKRQELNEKYDKFVSNYGLINSKTNAKVFGDDAGYHLLKSLEVKVKDEEKELYNSEYKKADIFIKNTINPISLIEKVDNSNDALLLSLAEKLEVDFEYMSKISDIPEEQLIEELSSSGLIFQNPDNDMKWESADEYLTGNIREKLDIAKNSGLEQNIIALEKVLPPDIEAQDISVKLGAYWIPEKYIRDFIIDTFNPDYSTRMNLNVIHEPHSDAWSVEGYNLSYNDVLVNETYGFNDGRNNGYKLIEMALNNQQPKIHKDKLDENGNVVLDAKGRAVRELDTQQTIIIQAKQNALIKKFSEWIMEDPNRRADIVERYNRLFNSVRLREYDGSHLRFVGMSSDVTLYPHQKNAIARALQGGNTLLAHEVGAGKTFEMVAIAMEGKRLGLHNKSLFAVPKHLTEQMGNAFRELYPNCNILVAGEKDFSTQNRKDMIAKIATGDWDAVIVGHSQFDRMRMSPEREKMYIEEELEELRLALEESDNNYGKKSFTVKQIEKTIKKHEAELLKIEERKNSDDFIDFEQLGIDKLFIDESQNYKNLSVPTKMRNVAGLGSSGSNKSLQLLMKCRYLDEITGHKGVIFASGTPISNSMTEMYSLMRYLQNAKLNEIGLTNFDRWANIFGETTTQMELKPTANGEYQMKTRFSKFNNLPELMTMFKECADIKTAATLNLPRPECETHNVVVHPSRIQDMYVKELGKRAEQIHDGNVDAHIDNMLKVTTDGRKIGLDARCINSNAPDDKKSKVNNCINNVFDIWEKTSENKSTQLIFCDMSTPHKPKNENIYLIMRKGSDGEYYSIYSDKLKNSDSPETIFNKLSNNPPKDFVEELGTLLSTDIIVTRTVDMKEEMAYHSISTCSDNKVTAIPEDNSLWKDVHLLPVQSFESEKRFCVYDDIKEKLIAKGVPEKEIAFIHDFEKPEDKQELFEKMNKGEIRIMIGSTSKCGAGMNAQQKMIALHDLDAPMRPSDMGQRRGRIERQGNENSKVDIYRYMTDRTFDAYLYQMLENKQKFIFQIMTEKVPVRSCEDIDTMVLEWAEAKALCSGNPLIKEQVDLKARISQLNNLKAEYLSQKYKLQDSIINYPTMKTSAENYIKKIEADIERIIPLTEDEEGKKSAPITIDGKEYTDKEEGANTLKEFVEKNRNELFFNNREIKIGEYRGFKISAIASELKSLDTSRSIQICLSGNMKHYCDFKLDAEINPIGNITRLNNALSNISEKELPKAKEKLENIESNYIKVQSQVDIPFEHEKELAEKEERLAVVDRELMSGKIVVDKECVLYQRICEMMPQLIECDNVYEKYDMGDDSGYEPLVLEKHDDICILMHSYVQNGDLMYDPAISFSVDREKQTIELISYELSGLSLYQDFTVEGSEDDRDACAEFMVDWLDNIDAQGYLERENSVEIA